MSAPIIMHFRFLVLVVVFTFLNDCGHLLEHNLGRKLYGTKNSYDNSFDTEELKLRENEHNKQFDTVRDTDSSASVNCHPIHINTVFRHGTRFPSAKNIRDAKSIISSMRSYLDNILFPDLKQWKVPFLEKHAKFLTNKGTEELKNLGKRFAKRYDKLFDGSSDIKFISSNIQRTIESAKAFFHGFLEHAYVNYSVDNIDIQNFPLRFYDDCERFVHTVEKNKTALKYFSDFKDSKELHLIAEKLSQRLGLGNQWKLTKGDVHTLYSIAGVENAVFGSSVWSTLLEDDLLIFEYASDLKNYWRKGHGYSINYEQSCPLLQNMFEEMEDAIIKSENNERHTKGVFRFGHAETIMPLYALLGLYNDSIRPTDTNFHQQHNRQFRASKISPFAANVGLILYKCKTNKNGQQEMHVSSTQPPQLDRYMVQLRVKELVEYFPFCTNNLCSYEKVRQYYEKHITNCDFEKMCKYTSLNKDEL